MAEIYSGAGVLKFTCNPITKSAGTIIMQMSKAVSALTNEKITVQIQRVNGQNVYAATKTSLKEFILARLCDQKDIINGGFGAGNIVVLDLGVEAGISLQDGEKIILDFEGVLAADTYTINYVEAPVNSNSFVSFETKAILDGEIDKTFDVGEYAVAVFKHGSLTEIGVVMGGIERRYTPYELRVLQLQEAGVYGITAAGVVSQIDVDYISMPLDFVSSLRFYKASAGSVQLTLMKYDELVPTSSVVRQVKPNYRSNVTPKKILG